jgi:hypothetical protein
MGMDVTMEVTIFGYAEGECGPFPCDAYRTCGLEECHPGGKFVDSCAALEKALKREYGDRIRLQMILLDEGIPDTLRPVIEDYHPAVPIVLVNGQLVPLGRVSLSHLRKYLTA